MRQASQVWQSNPPLKQPWLGHGMPLWHVSYSNWSRPIRILRDNYLSALKVLNQTSLNGKPLQGWSGYKLVSTVHACFQQPISSPLNIRTSQFPVQPSSTESTPKTKPKKYPTHQSHDPHKNKWNLFQSRATTKSEVHLLLRRRRRPASRMLESSHTSPQLSVALISLHYVAEECIMLRLRILQIIGLGNTLCLTVHSHFSFYFLTILLLYFYFYFLISDFDHTWVYVYIGSWGGRETHFNRSLSLSRSLFIESKRLKTIEISLPDNLHF